MLSDAESLEGNESIYSDPLFLLEDFNNEVNDIFLLFYTDELSGLGVADLEKATELVLLGPLLFGVSFVEGLL